MALMGRDRNWWSHSKTVALIWFSSLALFYFLFRMALHNSTSPSSPDSFASYSNRRSELYDKMERSLDEHGAAFLKHGETSQSLALSDLFTLKDGSVTPVLKAADPPVRANVLYMSAKYAALISEAVKQVFDPYFDKAIWFQNSSLYHFSMFHASHHIVPVPASEVEIEAAAVKAVVEGLCPLEIVLDRVVLTSTGVLLGCWQVISGTDPADIRAKLRTALPKAPEKQLYDAAILHTSFARLLSHPGASIMDTDNTSNQIELFHKLICLCLIFVHMIQATVSELWYVEEYDVLALALNGKMKVRRFQMGCTRG
ncbi:transcription factor bHLH47-like [Hibiscus syriacus]|uniref:Transcription factor bHLH47-like n=1 Tax=Hibiscus syriacus TaxID=106335 RepID=A0A6A3AS06_HIBSY|nr:transcription factor bHLH47-like [Hibiscus syriacus]